MKEITYEIIEQKIGTLYDPRYHYCNGNFFTEEEIKKGNLDALTGSNTYPNRKSFYTDPVDICLDYIAIKLACDTFSEDLVKYQDGTLELPDNWDMDCMFKAYDNYEKIVHLAKENVRRLNSIFEELKETEVSVETEAKHLFKNIPLFAHHI